MPKFGQFLLVVVITLAVNAGVWIISINLAGISSSYNLPMPVEVFFSILLFGIGLGQIIYILPISIYLATKRRFTWLQGVIVGAIITVLLNGGCWLLIIPNAP